MRRTNIVRVGFVFCLIIGIVVVGFLGIFPSKVRCYDSQDSVSILQSLKQEPLWRGIVVEDNQEKMVAVFGNQKTGSWTKISVDTKGNVCFVETGIEFQTVVKNTINL